MISLPRVSRLADESAFDTLLDDIIRNGRPLPLSVRMRLSEPDTLPSAAMGLALQRVLELTYRPTPVSTTLLRGLLMCTREDGSFGSISATAVALAALSAFIAQLEALPGGCRGGSGRYIDADLEAALRNSAARATAHLGERWRAAQRVRGGRALLGDEIDTAIALWQLALCPAFGRAVPVETLFASAEARGLGHDRRTAPLLNAVHPCAISASAPASAA